MGAKRQQVGFHSFLKIPQRRRSTQRRIRFIFVKIVAGPVLPRNQTPSTKSTAVTFYLSGSECDRWTEHLKALNCAWIMRNKVYKKNNGTLLSTADPPASVCRAEASLYLGKTHCTHLAGPVCVAMYRLCCGQYHLTWPGLSVLFPLNRNSTASTRTHTRTHRVGDLTH